MPDTTEQSATAHSTEPVTTEWVVHVQGPDDILPTLGRLDAHRRAHEMNTAMLAFEEVRVLAFGTHPSDADKFRPVAWAVPMRRHGQPETVTAAQVEADWTEYSR